MDKRLEKWDSILSNMNVTDEKKKWLSEYANLHSDSVVKSPEELIDSEINENKRDWMLPIVMKVASKTIGLDLVTVAPMGGGNSNEEIKKINQEIKIENRDRKIDALVEDKEFNEMKREEHPDYIKPKVPSGNLFYMDFVYGTSSSSTKI